MPITWRERERKGRRWEKVDVSVSVCLPGQEHLWLCASVLVRVWIDTAKMSAKTWGKDNFDYFDGA